MILKDGEDFPLGMSYVVKDWYTPDGRHWRQVDEEIWEIPPIGADGPVSPQKRSYADAEKDYPE